ncbi:MAG TPA: hypothetical protein VFS97_04135 [Nitrososphaeraceae archaeon]|nr:hypothetical protein [Nitrososphaeraceae archaeon]
MSNHHQVDKLVNGLSDRLARLDGNNGSGDNNNGSSPYNDGRNYWKGRKIIPSDQWLKLSKAKTSPGSIEELLEGIQYFPDEYIEHIWALGIPHMYKHKAGLVSQEELAIIEKEVRVWFSDYLELMEYKYRNKKEKP